MAVANKGIKVRLFTSLNCKKTYTITYKVCTETSVTDGAFSETYTNTKKKIQLRQFKLCVHSQT